MKREAALQRLFMLWIVVAIIPVSLVTIQTVAGKYGSDSAIAWSWLMAQITPVLSLLLATVFSSPSRAWREKAAGRFPLRCAIIASAVQGIAMTGILLLEPLLPVTGFDIFERTGIFLSLVQGVVVAAVGAVIFEGR